MFNIFSIFKKKNISNDEEIKNSLKSDIKKLMIERKLRAISVKNFDLWNKDPQQDVAQSWLHSIKIDFNGDIKLYDFYRTSTLHAGKEYINPDLTIVRNAYEIVQKIIKNEKQIPDKIKRNILITNGR